MATKKKTKKNQPSPITYTCDWCGKIKKQSEKECNFNKQALINDVHICNSCIADKYYQLAEQVGRNRAILMTSCILNIPVSIAGIRRLTVDDDFLSYVRKCNLLQNKSPYTNFLNSLAELPVIFETDLHDEQTIEILTECINEMQNTMKKVTKIRNSYKK